MVAIQAAHCAARFACFRRTSSLKGLASIRSKSLIEWKSSRTLISCSAAIERKDEVLRTLSENGQVSIIVVDGTNLIQEVWYNCVF